MPFWTKITISTSENASYGRVSGLVLLEEDHYHSAYNAGSEFGKKNFQDAHDPSILSPFRPGSKDVFSLRCIMITAYIGYFFFQHMRDVYFEHDDIIFIQRVVIYDCMVTGDW